MLPDSHRHVLVDEDTLETLVRAAKYVASSWTEASYQNRTVTDLAIAEAEYTLVYQPRQ